MKTTLKNKITGLTLFAALLPVVVMSGLTYVKKVQTGGTVSAELGTLIRDNTAQIVRDVYRMCEATHTLVQKQVNADLNVARLVLSQAGEVKESTETVAWQAVNQFTKGATATTLPKLTVGSRWLGQNRDLTVRTPVVDEVNDLVRGTCTIFQRMNEDGDMLRVATNVPTLNDQRAIGTYIPAKNPDGTANAVVSTVLKGETYRGPAFVVNAWYLTAYEPIRSKTGRIIGVLYVGVLRDKVIGLSDAIKEIRVGKTGYVWVIGTEGDQKGRYVIAKKGSGRDGESIEDEDGGVDGQRPIRDILKKAAGLSKGEVGYEEYYWKNPKDPTPRKKISAFMYLADWDWVIAAGTYADDYAESREKVEASLDGLLLSSIGCGGVLLIAMLGMAVVLGGRVADPISRITAVAQTIANGDLQMARDSLDAFNGEVDDGAPAGETRSKDETDQLLAATRTMTRNLNSLVGAVQQSGIQLTTSATQIASSAKELEATAAEQAASTNEAVATAKEITATAQDLARTMDDVTTVAADTASLATTGQAELSRMRGSMQQLSEATGSISSKLSAINEKANNISSVVTTINKVADQTNLLSLNAAIEAEKAGEYGQGFSVVAREIRRLADQTAIATLDIGEMVKEMQSAVATGVMEMDRFNQEVRLGVDEVSKISSQQAQIADKVQALTPRFEEVNHGMQLQTEGAGQISESMVQLSEAAQQTADSLREFNKATERLNEASRALQDEVSRFRVST